MVVFVLVLVPWARSWRGLRGPDQAQGPERSRSVARSGVRLACAAVVIVGLAVIALEFASWTKIPGGNDARLGRTPSKSRRRCATTRSLALAI